MTSSHCGYGDELVRATATATANGTARTQKNQMMMTTTSTRVSAGVGRDEAANGARCVQRCVLDYGYDYDYVVVSHAECSNDGWRCGCGGPCAMTEVETSAPSLSHAAAESGRWLFSHEGGNPN